MYFIYQFDKKSGELIEIPATPENIKEVILPPPGVVGFSNLFERGPTKGCSVIPTHPSSNKALHIFLSELLGLRMAVPLQGSIIHSERDTPEVKKFLQYLHDAGVIQRASSSLMVTDPLNIEAVVAKVKAANLTIHPYQHRRPLKDLFDSYGVCSTVPVQGFELYEKLGDKAVFHNYLMENGREDLCAPGRIVIYQGTQAAIWREEIGQVMKYSEAYPDTIVSRLYVEKDGRVLLEETSQMPWIQTMVLQEARGGGGMGTLVIARDQANTRWLVLPSDGGETFILNAYQDLISLIEESLITATITATPYLITDEIDGQEQSFSFCITWRDDKVVVAGPHWQRLVNKAFDGFYYNGPSEEFEHVVRAKEFTRRFASHLLQKGLLAEFPLRAGIDFFSVILPNGKRRLIAQDPNMRDTATMGLPMAALMRYGRELLNGGLVLSQADHVAIPPHEMYLKLQGVRDRIISRGVPLFGENSTGAVLQSIPKFYGNRIRLLVGYVAKNEAGRGQLESDFAKAFTQ